MRFILSFVYYVLLALPLKILSIFLFVLPKVRERIEFETKNFEESGAQSFRLQGIEADYCFEFSSEGEYQQVASLIDDALKASKKLELVFFSPSVEKTVLELSVRHPQQIRYLRYPFLRSGLSRWITARTLVLVRYDLFPEILLWAMKPGNKLKMVWVSFKREREKNTGVSLYKKYFLSHVSKLTYASKADQEVGESLGFKGQFYDFRIEQIRRRIEVREEKLLRIFPLYEELRKKMDEYPRHKRLIIGNAWPSDLSVLKDLPPDFLVVIVPHQLRPEIIDSFKTGMFELNRKMIELADQEVELDSNTFLINKKGILCELYADFGRSYVGGGFGTSVHSILEPLIAGSESLSCGPVHHRSTEYDVAYSLGRVMEVRTSEAFNEWLELSMLHPTNSILEDILNKYPEYRKEVISC